MSNSAEDLIKKLNQAKDLLQQALQNNESPMVEKAITNALLELYWAGYNLGECETLDVYGEIIKGGDGSDNSLQSPS